MPNSEVDAAWRIFVNDEKRRQFDAIVDEENLKRHKAVEFIENAYERGYVPEGGMELDGIMPPINPFDVNANREGKIANVLEKLKRKRCSGLLWLYKRLKNTLFLCEVYQMRIRLSGAR